MNGKKSTSLLLMLILISSGCLGEQGAEVEQILFEDSPPSIAYQPSYLWVTSIYANVTSQNNSIVFFGLDLDLDGAHDVVLNHNKSTEIDVSGAVQTYIKGSDGEDSIQICTYNFALMATDNIGLSSYMMGIVYAECE